MKKYGHEINSQLEHEALFETKWIGRMEKYLLEESVLNVGVFDEDTRFRSEGGVKKIDRIFQNKLESIVLELNEYLYDDGGRSA